MKKYAFTYNVHQTFSGPVTKHSFLLRCMPGTYPFQRSYAQKLTVTPFTAMNCITDVFGNGLYTGTIDKKHSEFSVTASGFVLCSKYLIHEPLDRLYFYPTFLTRPTPEMKRILDQASLSEDPWNRALQLCDLVHRTMTYIPATTENTSQRTAAEAMSAGKGDARDLSHVLLTLLRLTGIAARFVGGLSVGVSHGHSWVEVYCGNAWRALDPTTGGAVEEGYLKIANGPDRSACAKMRDVFNDPSGSVTSVWEISASVNEHVILVRDTVPRA